MPKAFSEVPDSLIRYRITHPDKDLRPLIRRLHKLPALHATVQSPTTGDTDNVESSAAAVASDAAREIEMTRMELQKWRLTIERILASAKNLEKQAERYRQRTTETAARTIELQNALEQDKIRLEATIKARERKIGCDAVYAKISARSKTKAELDDQITLLHAQVASHAESHAALLEAAQKRIELFTTVGPIVEQVKAMRLPVEVGTEEESTDKSMDVDEPSSTTNINGTEEEDESKRSSNDTNPSIRLSGAALPFQPPTAPSSTSTPAPAPPTSTSASAPAGRSRSARTSPAAHPPPQNARAASHALPTRPNNNKRPSPPAGPYNAGGSGAGGGAGGGAPGRNTRAASGSNLPNRPSALRKSTTPGARGLEEGEVDGREDGEVMYKRPRTTGGRPGARR